MAVAGSAFEHRVGIARYRCEAVDHHKDCPGTITDGIEGNYREFCLHHTIRKTKDRHDPNWDHRDDVVHLRLLWNGPTGIGLAGCHKVVHDDPDKARKHGLIAPRQDLTNQPTGVATP